MRTQEEIIADSNSNSFGGNFEPYQSHILAGNHLMLEVFTDIRDQLKRIADRMEPVIVKESIESGHALEAAYMKGLADGRARKESEVK